MNSRFQSKTQWQMFVLSSGRHVGVPPDGHQHGGSTQSSMTLGKSILQVSLKRKIMLTWILVKILGYLSHFVSQILEYIYWTVLIFFLWWRDSENTYQPETLLSLGEVTRTSQFGSWYMPTVLTRQRKNCYLTVIANEWGADGKEFCYMAESASGKDKANPVFLLATQAILVLSGYLALVP